MCYLGWDLGKERDIGKNKENLNQVGTLVNNVSFINSVIMHWFINFSKCTCRMLIWGTLWDYRDSLSLYFFCKSKIILKVHI